MQRCATNQVRAGELGYEWVGVRAELGPKSDEDPEREARTAIGIALLAFTCTFGGAVLGMQ
jgi:hypothetical protein